MATIEGPTLEIALLRLAQPWRTCAAMYQWMINNVTLQREYCA